MEIFPDSKEGLTATLAGLVIALCLHLVMKIINMTINIIKGLRESDGKKMDSLIRSNQDNTKAIHELTHEMKALNNRIVESDIGAVKTETNLNRLIETVRELAGEKWAEIQKKVRDNEFIDK